MLSAVGLKENSLVHFVVLVLALMNMYPTAGSLTQITHDAVLCIVCVCV